MLFIIKFKNYILCTILKKKKKKFKYFMGKIVIDLILFQNFVNMKGIR